MPSVDTDKIIHDLNARFAAPLPEFYKDYKYQDGDQITICITPVSDDQDTIVIFKYTAKATKKLNVLDSITFERIEE